MSLCLGFRRSYVKRFNGNSCFTQKSTCKDIFVLRYLHFISPHINSVCMKGFVPDMCRILPTYNLCHIINDYFCSNSLPSKAQWKCEISNAIGKREERIWLTRIDHDPDFSLFEHIQKYNKSVSHMAVPSYSITTVTSSRCCQSYY